MAWGRGRRKLDRYLASTRSDLAKLPRHVAEHALLYDRGEALWPRELASDAVNAIAESGLILHVIERGTCTPAGEVVTMQPVELYEPDGVNDVERARARMLGALNSLTPTDTHVCIAWRTQG